MSEKRLSADYFRDVGFPIAISSQQLKFGSSVNGKLNMETVEADGCMSIVLSEGRNQVRGALRHFLLIVDRPAK